MAAIKNFYSWWIVPRKLGDGIFEAKQKLIRGSVILILKANLFSSGKLDVGGARYEMEDVLFYDQFEFEENELTTGVEQWDIK